MDVYVTNVSGRGYCFVAPISRVAGQPAPLRTQRRAPPSPTGMVGRDETVRLISEELTTRRFLTIVGPGGIGKTTLAIWSAIRCSPLRRRGSLR